MLGMIQSLASEGNGKWLPHDLKEVLYGTIAFLIVTGLLTWKAGPFIKKALADRTARIAKALDDAKERQTSAEASANEIKSKLVDRDARLAEIAAEAEQAASQLRTDLVAKAKADAAAILERGLADVESTKRQAQIEIGNELSRSSLAAAEKVVTDRIDGGLHSDLIDQFINQVATPAATS